MKKSLVAGLAVAVCFAWALPAAAKSDEAKALKECKAEMNYGAMRGKQKHSLAVQNDLAACVGRKMGK